MSSFAVRISFAVALVMLITISIIAALPDPAVYFTSNLTATTISTDITPIEQALLDRINGAVTSIDATIYDFERISLRDALIAAKQRGVTVRVVADDEARVTYAPHFATLETAGIPIVDDQDDTRIMHDKYLIIDHQSVWTGSTNLSDNDLTLNHNNSIVFTSAQVANVFQHDFDQMIAGNFGSNKTASLTTTLTYNGFPLELYFSPQDNAMSQVISEVEAATSSIDFAIFFFTEDALRDALMAAHNRGVAVRGLWDALGAGNGSSDDEALCAAGIPIKIENTSGKMHHKLMVIDANGAAPRVITGSLNWTDAADNRNSENTVIVHDRATTQSYEAAFQTMWNGITIAPCVEETPISQLYLPVVMAGVIPTPTPIPTATPTPAVVRFMKIVYNPAGDDVVGELVQLHNTGTAVNITGWKITDDGVAKYTFPSFTLNTGATVTVWTRSGTDTKTDLFWGRAQPIWNNEGDKATLTNSNGTIVATCSYAGGGVETTCD